jgi:phage/plasmid-like protein (TIGR03299 family)
MEWTNEKPWQRLGVEIDSHLSAREMSLKLQLDWEVVKTPSQRPKSPANQETFRFFKAYVEAGESRIESIGSLDSGRILWALAPLEGDFTLQATDKVKPYLLMASRHENRQSIEIQFLAVREVCHNMLQVPVKVRSTLTNSFRRPFTTRFPFLNQNPQKFDEAMTQKAQKTFAAGREAISAFASDAERLANHKVDEATAIRYLSEVFQVDDKTEESIKIATEAARHAPGQELESAQMTVWGLVNAVTYTVDHHLGKNPDIRLRQAWFGANAKVKKRALELALAIL